MNSGLLHALFAGARAFVSSTGKVVKEVIGEVLREVDRSAIGRAVTSYITKAAASNFDRARSLSEEEWELVKRARRDGRWSEADRERHQEIVAERGAVLAEVERVNAERAAQEFKDCADETLIAHVDDDEISSDIGILAVRDCPNCSGSMRIQQGNVDGSTGTRKFYWQCTAIRQRPCPSIALDPNKERLDVLRRPNTDLDTPREVRRKEWNDRDVVIGTHGRFRKHLGEEDEQVVCPTHGLPMVPQQRRGAGGLLLDSYEYICPGVSSTTGRACDYKVSVKSMAQVAAALRRMEGEGIIRG